MDGELPVAIVGGGFSGTLLAINLLRLRQRVVLIERDAVKLAKGQAFGTRRPEHLLNVRAANMSAYPDDADHFVRWMGFAGTDQVNRFVPRLAYGQYLLEELVDALASAGEKGKIRVGEAVSAELRGRSVSLRLANGEAIECRAIVLALGNFPPAPLPVLNDLPRRLVFDDPWSPAAVQNLGSLQHVLLVGSGLTAVDAALSLEKAGYAGRITAISRRGLRPRAHAEHGPVVASVSKPQANGSALLRTVRNRAALIGWRSAIDELRPHVQDLWRSHSRDEQSRFLRHLRAYWDVHRHRLAPAVDLQITTLEQSGRLRFAAGKLIGGVAHGDRAIISFVPRGTAATDHISVDRVINCTGPDGNLHRIDNALIGDLLQNGQIRSDVHRVGLEVDRLGRVSDAVGAPQDRIYAVGPLTKGEAWEIVAVPDIRRRVWDLARYIANSHWVGGEGL